MSLVAVVIDSREPAWVQALTFGGAQTMVAPLDHGDLLATTDDGAFIAVERKTPEDLLGSLRDERLWQQLAGMVKQTRWSYLIVTGELTHGPNDKVLTGRGITGWSWAAVQGALVKAQELGVFVTFAAGDGDYEAAVMRLAARSRQQQVLLEPVKNAAILGEGEAILASLPGISGERIANILAYAGTAAWALQWLTDLNCPDAVPGVGGGIKRNVRRALGLKDGQELFVKIEENDGHGK
jgi:ERCC4-type nuclease